MESVMSNQCQRCHSQEDLITIPIDLEEGVVIITLCKKCILNGFKGVLEELINAEVNFCEDTEEETVILQRVIQNIPVVKRM